jgi:glycosyltransferase involved in cell wall biosynthesis
VQALSHAPVISVILPTHDTQLYHLHRCIESVTNQLYPFWELCVCDDASTVARVPQYLQERAATEPRIRLSFSVKRGGISAASNRAVSSSTGEFLVLLDHDDELHPAALLEVARCLSVHPDADLLYSDEDKIDQVGVRSCPAFKPNFDQDMLCAFNYLGHLVCLRAALVKQVGGFRSDSDGAQDWDLLLRVTSATSPARIKHIAKPLYHWRMHEESTAFSLDAKPYAIRAWNVVLERHAESMKDCKVRDGLFLGSMRIMRQLPQDSRVSILYRASDGPHQRRALNRSRALPQARFFEVVLSSIYPADGLDGSALLTVDDLCSDVTIVVNTKIDSVNHHFVEELVAQALRVDCGVVGGTILGADGTILTAGLSHLSDGTWLNTFEGLALTEPGYMGQARVIRRVSSIGPQVFAFRTDRLLEVNGLAAVGEDSLGDLCVRLVRQAHATGHGVLHTPYAVATLRRAVKPYHPQQGAWAPPELAINPNLEAFPDVTSVLKAGIH